MAIGCDIQDHGPVAESIRVFGEAYLRRVLHPQERAALERSGAPAAGPELVERVARLVTLKESVMKCLDLRPSDPISWTDIRCSPAAPGTSPARSHSGEPQEHRVELAGAAAQHARRRGIRCLLGLAGTEVHGGPGRATAQPAAVARVVALSGRTASREQEGTPEQGPGIHGDRRAVETSAVEAQHRGAGAWPVGKPTAAGLRAAAGPPPARAEDPAGAFAESGRESMTSREEIVAEVRQVVAQHGHLSQDAGALAESDSLYAAGMTSHASVNVMLGVEDAFDLEFPETMLTKETFESIAAIAEAVQGLEGQQ